MEHCKHCIRCTGCVWQFYSFGAARMFLLRLFLKLILWKEYELSELRELYKSITEFIAFYPERRKLTFYLMGYKIILWLSVDEATTHAV